MGRRLVTVILEMACGLYITGTIWDTSLDQGSTTDMDDATEARERSVCKEKGGQQDEQDGSQGLHYGRSDNCIGVLLICAQRNREYSHGFRCDYNWNKGLPVGKIFLLPLMGSFLMVVVPKTHIVDFDVGEMFYNFRFYPVLENYCIVDLGSYMGHIKYHKVILDRGSFGPI